MMGIIPTLAYAIDWGWLRIGPPYIYINIDPVIVHIGPLALRWYGLMYVVAIIMGLLVIRGYTARKGMSQDIVYRVLWWCIVAGLIGGRLYFVIQQPNFVSYYLANPQHILATWEGGMAFFGAIFFVIPVLFWRARVERINPLVAIDGGVLFAAAGQIFGRIGNLINGDIIGYQSTLPWSTVYQHPNSFACLNPATCNVPVQPAAAYELLANIALLALMLVLSYRLRRPGVLMLVYLFGYVTTQFLLFFVRANVVVSFLGLNWGLKQAQWTSLVVFILLIPLTFLVFRFSKPVPAGEVAATYGIPQKPKPDTQKPAPEEETGEGTSETPEAEQSSAEEAKVVDDKQTEAEEAEEKIES
jgi:phosphatidylglycerol---prolipoprotein diacylglyceryl transferase